MSFRAAFVLLLISAFSLSANAERKYVREVVGTMCPSVANEAVSSGLANKFFADRNRVSAGNKSFIEDNYTYCKLILFYDGPKMVFNKNYETEAKEAAEKRDVEVHRMMSKRCAAMWGLIEPMMYTTQADIRAESRFCMRDEKPLFMYTYRHEQYDMFRINLGVPNTENLVDDPAYLGFLREYGYMTAKDRLAAEVQAKESEQRQQQQEFERQAKLASERPKKSEIGAKLCQGQFVGFTEQRSPDNGKLQIRVTNRLSGNSEIIWDSPDNWSLCKS